MQSQPALPNKSKSGKISFRTARNAVAHHPIIFTALILTSLAVAAAVWFFMPLPKNTAIVVFQLSGHAPHVISSTGHENQVDLRAYGSQQVATVKRRQVLSTALNDDKNMSKAPNFKELLDMQPDKLGWLDKMILIDFKSSLEFMRVVIEGDYPDELVAFLRALSDSYMKTVKQRDNGARDGRLKAIEVLITERKGEIFTRKERMDAIAKILNTTDGLSGSEILNTEDLRAARKEALEIQQKVELAKAELPVLGAENAPVVIPPGLVDEAINKSPSFIKAEEKVAQAKKTLLDKESLFVEGTTSQVITTAKLDVKSAEASREKLRNDLRGDIEKATRDRVVLEFKLKSMQLKEEFNKLERKKKISDLHVQELKDRSEKHGLYRYELEKLKAEVASTEKALATLTEEQDRIRIEEKAPSRVNVAEEPFVLSGIEGFRRIRAVLIASLGLLLVGFFALVWFENRGRRVNTADELTTATDLQILGTIPVIDSASPHGNRILVESVDALRTQLLQARSHDRPIRTILVASGLSGEGKTTLSGHLVLSLARAGYRVLLVDGDLHAPTVHRLFDQTLTPGFCEVLRGEVPPDSAIRSSPVPGLSVMTAGSWNMATRQCLVGEQWRELREELQKDFDFIVIDTSPLLLMADTLLLAKAADAAMLSVLVGYSRIGAIALSQERLKTMGIPVLGAVVNGAAAEYTADYYGRYKYDATTLKLEPAPVTLTVA